MQTETIIRAVDYMPAPLQPIEGLDPVRTSETDGMVMRLFGAVPDYSKKAYEKLWQEVFNADEKEMVDYCRSKGIDVLDDAKKPVPGWRDIAVMLKAVDAKLIERA